MNLYETVKILIGEFESKTDTKVHLVSDIGSTAHGLASPSSDYDVRFIYSFPTKKYIDLEDLKINVASFFHNNELKQDLDKIGIIDINGWDIRKALKLSLSSNPTITEVFYSPIVYHSSEFDLRNRMIEYFEQKYDMLRSYNAYRGTLKSEFKEKNYGKNTAIVKKYANCIRLALSCMYIARYGKPPYLNTRELLEKLNIKRELLEGINEIFKCRVLGKDTLTKCNPVVDEFLKTTVKVKNIGNLEVEENEVQAKYDHLNSILADCLIPNQK